MKQLVGKKTKLNGESLKLSVGTMKATQLRCIYSCRLLEFPATLIATETGRILSEFHEYVQPIECGQISEFCTRLTGITQTQCDSAAPLRTVLAQFNEWLRRVAAEHRLTLPKSSAKNKLGNTVLLSWSDWDFGVCLANECSRKGIQKAAYFDQWCDLRAVYKEFQQYRPKNFSDALQNVGMEFIGRPHCGRDDARMTARLAVELAKKGALINVTKDLKPFIVFNKQF